MSIPLDAEARQIVAELDERQRAAIFRAIVDAQPRTFVPPPPVVRPQAQPARRRPTTREIVRGVHCCDPRVEAWWRSYRRVVSVLPAVAVLAVVVLLSTPVRQAIRILYGMTLVAGIIVCLAVIAAGVARSGPGKCH